MDDNTKPTGDTLAFRVGADYYCLACGVPEHKPATTNTPCGKAVAVVPFIIDRITDETDLYDGGLGGDHSELAVEYRCCATCGESLEPEERA